MPKFHYKKVPVCSDHFALGCAIYNLFMAMNKVITIAARMYGTNDFPYEEACSLDQQVQDFKDCMEDRYFKEHPKTAMLCVYDRGHRSKFFRNSSHEWMTEYRIIEMTCMTKKELDTYVIKNKIHCEQTDKGRAYQAKDFKNKMFY